MITVRFSNFFRHVDVVLSEDCVDALRNGGVLASVLSPSQIDGIEAGMTNRSNGLRVPWKDIHAKTVSGDFIWSGQREEDRRHSRAAERAAIAARLAS